jgi:nucleoside-diphosphate-sugar epimerase
MPLLEASPRIARIVGIARRPFDPSRHGWTKMEYRQGDVRDADGLRTAFEGCDVVVHLAFMITGAAPAKKIRAINVDGTLNAFGAARDVGAARFVYASSVAAYGFHPDNPVGIKEDWPTRPAARLFYAQEKAELEQLLANEAEASSKPELYLVRPPIVLGPHAVGGKGTVPPPVASAGRVMLELARRLPVPVPVLVPDLPLQFIHEEDVGQALLKCVLAEGPPGAYNIAGDGVLSGADVTRELGLAPVAIPARAVHAAARAAAQSRSRRLRRPPPSGWRPPAIRRSWTPPRPKSCWAGTRGTAVSRPCGRRFALTMGRGSARHRRSPRSTPSDLRGRDVAIRGGSRTR